MCVGVVVRSCGFGEMCVWGGGECEGNVGRWVLGGGCGEGCVVRCVWGGECGCVWMWGGECEWEGGFGCGEVV